MREPTVMIIEKLRAVVPVAALMEMCFIIGLELSGTLHAKRELTWNRRSLCSSTQLIRTPPRLKTVLIESYHPPDLLYPIIYL